MWAAWLTSPARVWDLAAPFEQPGKGKKKNFLKSKNKNLRQSTLENPNICPLPTTVCCLPSSWLALFSRPRQPKTAKCCQGQGLIGGDEDLRGAGLPWRGRCSCGESPEEAEGKSRGRQCERRPRSPLLLASYACPRPRDSRAPAPRCGRGVGGRIFTWTAQHLPLVRPAENRGQRRELLPHRLRHIRVARIWSHFLRHPVQSAPTATRGRPGLTAGLAADWVGRGGVGGGRVCGRGECLEAPPRSFYLLKLLRSSFCPWGPRSPPAAFQRVLY